jgi:uncharacterized protein (DUF697 family)
MLSGATLFKVLREIDLASIKRESEKRFRILLLGPVGLTGPVGTHLSTSRKDDVGAAGVHPWLVQHTLDDTAAELGTYGLAVLVTTQPEPDTLQTRWLKELRQARVPVLTVVQSSDAAKQPGVSLPRPLEHARVVTTDSERTTLQETLATALLKAVPADLRLSLARQLPLLRTCYMRALTEDTARANAMYVASTGLAKVVPILNIPMNVADFFILTKNQLVMAYRIALAGGKEGNPQDLMGEIVSVLGGGFFFRQVAREMVGLIPVWGILPNIAVSYAGTWLVGQAVTLWVREGKNLSVEDMRNFYGEALERGRALAQRLPLVDEEGAQKRRALFKRLTRRHPKVTPTDSPASLDDPLNQPPSGEPEEGNAPENDNP